MDDKIYAPPQVLSTPAKKLPVATRVMQVPVV